MLNMDFNIIFKGNNFIRLLEGLFVTLRISIISMLISIVIGFILGMLMTLKNKYLKIVLKFYLETVRIMPQLVLLFLVYFGTSKHFGINLSASLSAILVFTFWGSAEVGDLVRGALQVIPRHQYDSSYALALKRWQVSVYIIFPQAIRRLLPALISLFTRMIKTTSLVALIGVVEVLKVGKQIIDASRYTNPKAAIYVYLCIFILYFCIAYPFSLLAKSLEKRFVS